MQSSADGIAAAMDIIISGDSKAAVPIAAAAFSRECALYRGISIGPPLYSKLTLNIVYEKKVSLMQQYPQK